MAATPGVETATGSVAREIHRHGAGWEVRLTDGRVLGARVVALAVPPSMAAALLRTEAPELSAELARVHMAAVETVGVVVARGKVAHLPELAFIVPAEDVFWSAVTRDPVPDPERRAFAFHFRTGRTDAEKTKRICDVLGVQPADFLDTGRRMTLLPSPVLGHDRTVHELDRLLAGSTLALTGNYFAGLAIEDCVARSKQEWRRVAAAGGPG
jgi:oxygen-dependent protoporphyrinogen oxidase